MHLLLFLIAYMDMKEKRIPNILSVLLFLWFFMEDPLGVFWAVFSFPLFFLLYCLGKVVFRKEVLGSGDVKLLSVLVYGLKSKILEFIFVSFFMAGLFGLLMLLLGRKKEESFAFAPFLVLGFLFCFH